jgi:hypothetical protein
MQKKKWPTASFSSIHQPALCNASSSPLIILLVGGWMNQSEFIHLLSYLLTYLPTAPILYRRGYQEKTWCQLSQYSSTTESQQTSILLCTRGLLVHSGWNHLCCRCVSSSSYKCTYLVTLPQYHQVGYFDFKSIKPIQCFDVYKQQKITKWTHSKNQNSWEHCWYWLHFIPNSLFWIVMYTG